MYLLDLAFAFVGGICIVLTRMVCAKLAERYSIWDSIFVAFFTGSVFAILLFLLSNPTFALPSLARLTPFMFTGGMIGIAINYLSNKVALHISVFTMTLLIFIGQMVTGMVLDWIQTQQLQPLKLLGACLVVVGLYFYTRQNKA
ncbi:MAG: DMT family transporter [Erysipelotrichaceae bacterium]